MAPLFRESETSSIVSDSSSRYSEDELECTANVTDTHIQGRCHVQPQNNTIPGENAWNLKSLSTTSFRQGPTPDLDEDHGSNGNKFFNPKNSYQYGTLEEAEKRRRRITAEAEEYLPVQTEETYLEEPKTYMERVLAEHDAPYLKKSLAMYPSEHEDLREELGTVRSTSACDQQHRHFMANGGVSTRNARCPSASCASTDASKLAADYIKETSSLRSALRESLAMAEPIPKRMEPLTPQPRNTSPSRDPFMINFQKSSLSASNRQAHQDVTLDALDGATGSTDDIESSASMPSAPTRGVSAFRRRGGADWRRGGLFSSSGRRYGTGDKEEGYVSGDYVTITAAGKEGSHEKIGGKEVWLSAFPV
jgi:hypothetical protein